MGRLQGESVKDMMLKIFVLIEEKK